MISSGQMTMINDDLPCKGDDITMETYAITMETDDELKDDVAVTDENSSRSWLIAAITILQSFQAFWQSARFKKVLLAGLSLMYFAYFKAALIFAGLHFCSESHSVVPLVVLTCVTLFLILVYYVSTRFGDDIRDKLLLNVVRFIDRHAKIFRWTAALLTLGGVVAVVFVTVKDHPTNLVSLAGLVFFVFVLFVFSANPAQVKWRPVIGGLLLQFYVATIILQWEVGYSVFTFLGDQIRSFLAFTDVGSRFVFGEKMMDHFFAMKVLPMVVFFNSVITMLYHLGVMQAVIRNMAYVMRCTLGTTAAESLCAAGNIFVGQTEAPILVRPFLPTMTKSELHAVMVGGFSTVAGAGIAAYIQFGISPEHLMCASVMSAPCALAVSKLLYPETEKSTISQKCAMPDMDLRYRNLIEAAAAGASQSISLIANMAANLIAFLALLAFLNSVIAWFGAFVCLHHLSFESICHYLLMPIVYLMGVTWEDAGHVAELVALKTFLNEFVAYEKLSEFINARLACDHSMHHLSLRSEAIATYALCGFSNLGSIGIVLGGLGPMAPTRVGHMAQVAVSALFGGIVTCLITATVAGLLVVEPPGELVTCVVAVGNASLNGTATLTTTVSKCARPPGVDMRRRSKLSWPRTEVGEMHVHYRLDQSRKANVTGRVLELEKASSARAEYHTTTPRRALPCRPLNHASLNMPDAFCGSAKGGHSCGTCNTVPRTFSFKPIKRDNSTCPSCAPSACLHTSPPGGGPRVAAKGANPVQVLEVDGSLEKRGLSITHLDRKATLCLMRVYQSAGLDRYDSCRDISVGSQDGKTAGRQGEGR
ncbi:hypothetical protein BaRGS_00005906, partial [Batillaria attramentaria]